MWQMIGSTYFEGAETPDGDNILVPMVKAIEELTRTCLVATFILYLYVLVLHTPNPDVPGAWTDCELVAAHSSPQINDDDEICFFCVHDITCSSSSIEEDIYI